MRRLLRKISFQTLYLLGLAALCLLSAELYFRLKPLTAGSVRDAEVDNLEFHYSVHLNSDYFRDGEFRSEKLAGEFRVLLLGDSFVYGAAVDSGHTLDRLLEEKLDQAEPSLRHSVYNLGIVGTDPPEYKEVARRFKVYHPDLVIVSLYVDNDIRKTDAHQVFKILKWKDALGDLWDAYLFKRGDRDCMFSWLKGFEKKADSALYGQACQGKINPHLLQRANDVPDQEGRYRELVGIFEKDPLTRKALLGIRDLFPGIPFLLVLQPSKYQVSEEYLDAVAPLGFDFPNRRLLGRDIQDSILAWARENSIDALDVLPAMRSASDKHFYHRIDDHYNERGNEFVADLISKRIEGGLAPPRGPAH